MPQAPTLAVFNNGRSTVGEAEQKLDELMKKCETFSNFVEKLKLIHDQKNFNWRSLYLHGDRLLITDQ